MVFDAIKNGTLFIFLNVNKFGVGLKNFYKINLVWHVLGKVQELLVFGVEDNFKSCPNDHKTI